MSLLLALTGSEPPDPPDEDVIVKEGKRRRLYLGPEQPLSKPPAPVSPPAPEPAPEPALEPVAEPLNPVLPGVLGDLLKKWQDAQTALEQAAQAQAIQQIAAAQEMAAQIEMARQAEDDELAAMAAAELLLS